jgi:DNA polymerase-1
MGHLLYNCLGIRPFKFTKGNKPSTDKEVLDELIDQHRTTQKWMTKLSDYRKLGKLLSTYVDGILERQIDGIIYTSMLQFGTTSGRFSSRNPNLQNQFVQVFQHRDYSSVCLDF